MGLKTPLVTDSVGTSPESLMSWIFIVQSRARENGEIEMKLDWNLALHCIEFFFCLFVCFVCCCCCCFCFFFCFFFFFCCCFLFVFLVTKMLFCLIGEVPSWSCFWAFFKKMKCFLCYKWNSLLSPMRPSLGKFNKRIWCYFWPVFGLNVSPVKEDEVPEETGITLCA